MLLFHCRVGSTLDFTHAVNQQPGMGSRKYEKATTLPSNASASQKIDRDNQLSTKSSLVNSMQASSISSSTSSPVGNSFWSRTAVGGKFGGHSASSFQDFDNSVSDAWDIKDVKGLGYGGSNGPNIVIDVQPTSASPFSIAKTNSLGPEVHGKRSAKESSQSSTAKHSLSISSDVVGEKNASSKVKFLV